MSTHDNNSNRGFQLPSVKPSTIKNDKDLVRFIRRLIRIADQGNRFVLITGPSGIGKSYICDLLRSASPAITSIDLDAYGSIIDGKHIVDFDKAFGENLNADVFLGTSDNIGEAHKFGNLLTFRVDPSADAYVKMQAAKAKDGQMKNLNPEWIKGWRDKSKLNPKQVERELDEWWIKKRLRYHFYAIRSIPTIQDVAGWHKYSKAAKTTPVETAAPEVTNEPVKVKRGRKPKKVESSN